MWLSITSWRWHSSCRQVLRCLLEGIQWLRDPSARVRVAGKSGISHARTRLGWEPLWQLHDELVKPVAAQGTKGAWHREWRHAVGVVRRKLHVYGAIPPSAEEDIS